MTQLWFLTVHSPSWPIAHRNISTLHQNSILIQRPMNVTADFGLTSNRFGSIENVPCSTHLSLCKSFVVKTPGWTEHERNGEWLDFLCYSVNTRRWVCWCLGAIVVDPSQRWERVDGFEFEFEFKTNRKVSIERNYPDQASALSRAMH